MLDRPLDSYLPPSSETLRSDASEPVLVGDGKRVQRSDAQRRDGFAVAARFARGRAVRFVALGLIATGLLGAVFLAADQIELMAAGQQVPVEPEPEELPLVSFNPTEPFTFRGLDIHPDRMHAAYFDGAFLATTDSSALVNGLNDFRYRLDMYVKAYGQDDNFSIRILDERTGETLEVLTLRELKADYERSGRVDWNDVDFPHRRTATSALTAKWAAMGIPREALTIRWGRANQTFEARDRDAPFVEYEIQLARRLGLSLLATEIGTVETFNQDALTSSAGARSRYQMMPDIMRLFNVEQYAIPVVGGGTVAVREEHHPLLSMEPSMMLVRAYSNAVGHELPGVSAYHTGPGNIFHLYQTYLRAHASADLARRHVSDAYMWGVTDGFERVDAESSFGKESRAYVMKAYGSLRATEDRLVDPALTLRAERVQLRTSATITLAELLRALAPQADRLAWGAGSDGRGLYDRFRALNPHIALPAAPMATGATVPARGDLRLTSTSEGEPLRFFLPEGASEVLRRAGVDALDPSRVFPFNRNTWAVQSSDRTDADRAYDDLVEDIGRFGFTTANQQRLVALNGRMQSLAEQNPTRYRQTQAKIIGIHRSVWATAAFRDLAGTVETLLTIAPQRRAEQAQALEDARTNPVAPLAPRPTVPVPGPTSDL